jgi:putative hydrolase of the HAD superfamily
MSRSKPALVVFDMNDVVCRYDLSRRISVLSHYSGVGEDKVRARIWNSGFEDQSDGGRFPDRDGYLSEFCRRLEARITAAQWIEACRFSITPYMEVLGLAKDIGRGTRIALFSNNGPLMKASFKEIFPQAHEIFGTEFYCSFEFGAAKPDPASYKRLTARLGFQTDHCYYIDDKISNIEGAVEAGLRGHHFTSAAILSADARALGLIA